MTKAFDNLAQKVMATNRQLRLVTDDVFVVLDEEREALSRVIGLVQEWSLEDRRH